MGVEFVELCEDSTIVVCGVPLKRKPLAKLRRSGKRCGSWFRNLKEGQRKLMDLVIMVVERVQSLFLARLLLPIIKVLVEAMGDARGLMEAVVGKVAYLMRKEGRSLAQKLSRIAKGWGNKSAAGWPEDKGFIQYLTIMNLPENKPL